MDTCYNLLLARVLVVDDNEMARQMLRAVLENGGLKVREAKNGIEAVDMVEAEKFDLVLMDIQMPVLDGLGATRAIRSLNKKQIENLPIIAMTAYGLEVQRQESIAAGMNGHIVKPIELRELYAELQRWLPVTDYYWNNQLTAGANTDISDLEAALPEVDVKAGIDRVVGSRQTYLKLLRRFVAQFSTPETDFQRELATEQKKGAIRWAHTLRGVAGGLGAARIEDLAGQLERQLIHQEGPDVLIELVQELGHLVKAIKSLPDINPVPDVAEPMPVDNKELRAILEPLLEALQGFQVQAVKDHLHSLQEKNWPKTDTKKLQQLIEQYQFNLAADLVETLLSAS